MAFLTDKEELKPGLIIFRRGDVEHRMWSCWTLQVGELDSSRAWEASAFSHQRPV